MKSNSFFSSDDNLQFISDRNESNLDHDQLTPSLLELKNSIDKLHIQPNVTSSCLSSNEKSSPIFYSNSKFTSNLNMFSTDYSKPNILNSFQTHITDSNFIDFDRSKPLSNNSSVMKDSLNFSCIDLNDDITEREYQNLGDNVISFCRTSDPMRKRNILNVITQMLQKSMTTKQCQTLLYLVSDILNGVSENYYSDPLQSFYNNELVTLLTNKKNNNGTNRNLSSIANQVDVETFRGLNSLMPNCHGSNSIGDWPSNTTIYTKGNHFSDSTSSGNFDVLSMYNKKLQSNSHYNSEFEDTVSSIQSNQNNSLNGNLSLKDEITLLSLSYRNRMGNEEKDIETAAALYRTSATTMAQRKEASYQWCGKLMSPNVIRTGQFSRKVFLGGVPWDSTEEDLKNTFSRFGTVSIMFPQKELNGVAKAKASINGLKGYCYLIFDFEESVNHLLSNCTKNPINGGDYYKIASAKFKAKDVQVIPWLLQDSQFTKFSNYKPDSKKTVFVGALHGMMTAASLAQIMDELFDNVTFAALDTDKYKYPIGSGRITFSSNKSYMLAVTANFVHIKTQKFTKTIQIDPYLEDSMCNNCFQSPGIYFCRSFECFRYFCSSCWQMWHKQCETLFAHKPLRRTFKPLFLNA